MRAIGQVMSEMLEHEGIWQGTYRYVDNHGEHIDFHQSRVECVFPPAGPYAYVRKNLFTWEDPDRCIRFNRCP